MFCAGLFSMSRSPLPFICSTVKLQQQEKLQRSPNNGNAAPTVKVCYQDTG
jgi:hypothetical protein